jgi:hypothetical protein
MTDLPAKTGIWQWSGEFKAAQAAPVCGMEGTKFRQRCWAVNSICWEACSVPIRAICTGGKSPRAVAVFLICTMLIRIMCRRAFGMQSYLDISLAVLIGAILSRAVTGTAPFVGTTIAAAAIALCYWALAHLSKRFHAVGCLVKVRRGYWCATASQTNRPCVALASARLT